jgi:hypothetical protein
MSNSIYPQDLNQSFYASSLSQVTAFSNEAKMAFADLGQLTKESLERTGEITFRYLQDNGGFKMVSLRVGKDTPFFLSIQDKKSLEDIKKVILDHVSSLFNVHKVAQSKLAKADDFSTEGFLIVDSPSKSPHLGVFRPSITQLDLSETDITGFDLSEFLGLKVLDLQGVKGDLESMFAAIPPCVRNSVENLDLSDTDVTFLELSGFINLKNLDLEDARGGIEEMFNTIPFDVRASVESLDLDGADIQDFDFLGFTRVKTLFLSDDQILSPEQRRQLVALDSSFLLKESMSSSGDTNGKRITQLVRLAINNGEDWKEYFNHVIPSISRLRNTGVIEDCMRAMDEIDSHELIPLKEGGDESIFLEKKILDENTEVITTGDLHGDAYSLAKMLKKLRSTGHLDLEFKLKENTELVFLGDYVDRGPDSWIVLNILARLKLNNINKVHLIRGNHEDIGQIFREGSSYGDWMKTDNDLTNRILTTYSRDSQDKPNNDESRALERFFNSLPNAVFLGVKRDGSIEYDIYTHGVLPLSFNPSKFLSEDDGMYSIPRRASELGEHSFNNILLPPLLEYQKRDDFFRSLSAVRWAISLYNPLFASSTEDTEWNWADITVIKESGHQLNRGACINLNDLITWMDLSQLTREIEEGSEGIVFKRLFKGHSHKLREIVKGFRGFYLLDTDLYLGGDFIMHSHHIGNGNSWLATRSYEGEFVEGKDLEKSEDF